MTTTAITLNNRFTPLASPAGLEVNDAPRRSSLLPGVENRQPSHTPNTSYDIHLLTKTYFKILQAIHHSEILTNTFKTDTFPHGMMRQVNRLTSFIKPSSPNITTHLKIKQNTDNWMHTNMTILREHYDTVIAVALDTIPPFSQTSLDKAIQWGGARYRRKLTSSSVNTLRDLISRVPPAEGVASSRALALSPHDFPPLSAPANSPLQQTHPLQLSSSPPPTTSLRTSPSPPPVTSPSPPPVTSPPLVTIPSPSPPPTSLPPSLPAPLNSTRQPTHQDLCTYGGDVGGPDVTTAQLPRRNPSREVRVELHHLPRAQIQRLRGSQTGPSIGSLALPSSPPPPPLSPSSHTNHTHRSSNVALPCSNTIRSCSPTDSPPKQRREPSRRTVGPANTKASAKVGNKAMMMKGTIKSNKLTSSPTSELSTLNPNRGSTAPPGSSEWPEPHRHPNTFRKLQDWSLTVRKTTLIVGDSNLSHIPPFTDPHIQIDSYPGATFYHLTAIFNKLTPQLAPLHIILSIGLNNCLSEQHLPTIRKQLQALWRTSQITFPNATIHIPVINFSFTLDPKKQYLLTQLNTIISNKYNFIPEINPLLFHVSTKDNIHWTAETAGTLFRYWKQHLNM